MSEIPWFKVDDKLHDHRKARAAAKAAMGVWVLAGSWSADNLMNGFVPASVLTRWGTRADAKRLVDAGLWHDDEQDGERGWRFHEWEKYQPSRESVEAERAEARARMAELRANRKANKAKGSGDVRANTDRTSEEVRSAPTRPDPTTVPDGTTKSPSSAGADGVFEAWWKLYPKKVGKADARKVWDRKIRKSAPDAITAGLQRWLPIWRDTDPQFIPYPSTWLQRGSWDDELGELDVDAILGAEKFQLPETPDDLVPGSPEWQAWQREQRDAWVASREARAREVLARRAS